MLSVQPGIRGSNDLRFGRKMATFQLFFQSGRANDLSAPLIRTEEFHYRKFKKRLHLFKFLNLYSYPLYDKFMFYTREGNHTRKGEALP